MFSTLMYIKLTSTRSSLTKVSPFAIDIMPTEISKLQILHVHPSTIFTNIIEAIGGCCQTYYDVITHCKNILVKLSNHWLPQFQLLFNLFI